MALSTGATIYDLDGAGLTTLVSSGSAVINGDFSGVPDAAVGSGLAVFCDLILTLTMNSDPGDGTSILVYRRDLDIDGTTDAPQPDLNYKGVFVGSFLVDSSASSQTLILPNAPLAGYDAEFYIENITGIDINAAWVLKGLPKGYNVHT